jgi:hypothetical protein
MTTLFSALEDLQQTTLTAITGCLRRLEYLSGLRDQEGNYHHWGFTRVHGDMRARKALADAHRTMLSRVLSTPIRTLENDVEESSHEAGMAPGNYLERLSAGHSKLLPPTPGTGSGRHLSSVLHALVSLRKHPKSDANPPA